ncbi:hypothetical protein C0991_001296 [Blastosporella zonata]|nr:hypothetical protein C0991_001296 [Blastosporella zonata]
MVGAINAPDSGNLTFTAYQNNAKTFQGASGQGEGGLVGVGASASSGPGPKVSGAQFFTGAPLASATATAPSSPGNSSAPQAGAGGNGTSTSNGAFNVATNSLVVALGMMVGAFVVL